jgi:hypothetical protein
LLVGASITLKLLTNLPRRRVNEAWPYEPVYSSLPGHTTVDIWGVSFLTLFTHSVGAVGAQAGQIDCANREFGIEFSIQQMNQLYIHMHTGFVEVVVPASCN